MSVRKKKLLNQLSLLCNIFRRGKIHFAIIALFVYSISFAQSNHETRGVWISTNYRLDWPPKSLDEQVQKRELTHILKDIRKRNFNTVYFQVRSGGTLIYPSDIEPLSPYIPHLSKSTPSYDPLKFAVEQAHKQQLEIHAWINVFNVTPNYNEIKKYDNFIMNRHPNWIVASHVDGTTKYWIDPGLPEAIQYLIDLVLEIVERYDIDGIVLDYLRYPEKKFNDDFSYTIYGEDKERDKWRRENINSFMDSLYKKVKKLKPYLKIGVSPLGVYKNKHKKLFLSAFEDVYQDALFYLKNGIVDYITPQIYWPINFKPSFKNLSKFWINNSFGRNIVINIGAYKPEVKRELFSEIKTARKLGAEGIAIYRYSNIKNNQNIKFNSFVFPKEMFFIDKSVPKEPKNLSVNINSINPLSIILGWSIPKNSPDKFALYKFAGNKPELITLLPGNRNSIRIQISNPESSNYTFSLKSLSKLKNESPSYSNKVSININELTGIYNSLSNESDETIHLIQNKYLFINSLTSTIVKISTNNKKNVISLPILKGPNLIPVDISTSAVTLNVELNNKTKVINLNK